MKFRKEIKIFTPPLLNCIIPLDSGTNTRNQSLCLHSRSKGVDQGMKNLLSLTEPMQSEEKKNVILREVMKHSLGFHSSLDPLHMWSSTHLFFSDAPPPIIHQIS